MTTQITNDDRQRIRTQFPALAGDTVYLENAGGSQVPAIVAVGLWFVFQLVNGLGMLGGSQGGGVAYAAHIGGFIAGLILIKLFDRGPRTRMVY